MISFKSIGEIAPLAAFGLSASVLCPGDCCVLCRHRSYGSSSGRESRSSDSRGLNHTGLHDPVSTQYPGGGFASAFV